MSECLCRKLLGKYGGDINLQRIIEDYIMLIQIRIKKNEIKAASGQVRSTFPPSNYFVR
jgi:hypothetical protein